MFILCSCEERVAPRGVRAPDVLYRYYTVFWLFDSVVPAPSKTEGRERSGTSHVSFADQGGRGRGRCNIHVQDLKTHVTFMLV